MNQPFHVPDYNYNANKRGKWIPADWLEVTRETRTVDTVSYTSPTTLEFDYQGKHYVLDNRGFMGWTPAGDEWDQAPFVHIISGKNNVESYLVNGVTIAKKVLVEMHKQEKMDSSMHMLDAWEEGTGGGVWKKA